MQGSRRRNEKSAKIGGSTCPIACDQTWLWTPIAHWAAFSPVDLLTIADLKSRVLQENRVESDIHAQVETCNRKDTRDGKPFYEVSVADSEGKLALKAWSDSPAFALCESLSPGDFVSIRGEFALNPQFGLEAKRWTSRPLNGAELEALLAGPPALRERQAADFGYIGLTFAAEMIKS